MTKYLIDASIIGSSLEEFKRKFISQSECILILSDLTFRELEARKRDSHCSLESKRFVRFLIDLFVKEQVATEICRIENECPNGHIDEELVKYARDNNLSVLTCDKGMALWCRFYKVNCELLGTRTITKLDFVIENGNSLYLNLYNNSIPKGSSVFVYSPTKNKIKSPLDNGMIFLHPGNIILVAHPENGACCIDTHCVTAEMAISLLSKNIYQSEEDIDVEKSPFHTELFKKWTAYMKKVI